MKDRRRWHDKRLPTWPWEKSVEQAAVALGYAGKAVVRGWYMTSTQVILQWISLNPQWNISCYHFSLFLFLAFTEVGGKTNQRGFPRSSACATTSVWNSDNWINAQSHRCCGEPPRPGWFQRTRFLPSKFPALGLIDNSMGGTMRDLLSCAWFYSSKRTNMSVDCFSSLWLFFFSFHNRFAALLIFRASGLPKTLTAWKQLHKNQIQALIYCTLKYFIPWSLRVLYIELPLHNPRSLHVASW